MSVRSTAVRTALPAVVLLALQPGSGLAAWPSDPTTNVPVSVAAGGQWWANAASDGAGGAIVAWDDLRGGTTRDLYLQRIDATGTPRWTANGVALCTAANEQYMPQLVSDGSGGVIAAWTDYRGGVAYDIYVQRVDSTGTPRWTANGVALCAVAGWQSEPVIVADGSGGAIVAWQDARVGNDRIYAQRVNANGAAQWTANGVVLTNALAGQAEPVIVSNGAGGAIVCWQDYRNGAVDIFAQRILANGALDPAWPLAGRAIAINGDQDPAVMAVDDSGGAYLAWGQWNGGTRDVYVHHVLAAGTLDPAWPAAGRAVLTDFGYDQGRPAIVRDGAGGAIVAWDDQRGTTARTIYAQHLLDSGVLDPAWPAAGLELCVVAGDQVEPLMVADGAGGAVVAWLDTSEDEGDFSAHHVTAGGGLDPDWPANGRAICTADLRQFLPTMVGDGTGGAILAWSDARAGSYDDADVYAQRVRANGQLGDEPVGIPGTGGLDLALGAPRPNPARGSAMLVPFTLATDATASLELFDVAGRRVYAREVGSLGAGPHVIELAHDARPGPGIYFVRLRQGDGLRTRRIVVLDD